MTLGRTSQTVRRMDNSLGVLGPRLSQLAPLTDPLIAAAEVTAAAARRKYRAIRRRKAGRPPRAGADTPLWNELARACAAQLTRYGEKAKLARLLGISRQRLHVLLVSRSACTDSERTLMLLAWLNARAHGKDPN